MKDLYKLSAVAFLGASVLVGCGGDDSSSNDTTDTETPENVTVLPALAYKATTEGEPEYLIQQDITAGNDINAQGTGLEQVGWNYYHRTGKTIFVTGYQNYETLSYRADEQGELAELGSFFYDSPIEVFSNADDNTLLALDTPRDGTHTTRLLYVVDASTGQITEKLDLTIFDDDTGTPGEGSVGYPLGLVVHGDTAFIPFHKLDDAGNFTTPDPDTAYVAVYDYPLSENAETGVIQPTKIISDDRTSNIGLNGGSNGLIKTDSGDIYSFSNGTLSGGFNPASTKPSGILKIADGTTEFDSEYFFNISEATDGGTIFWFDYLGDNLALARILTDEDGCKAVSEENDDACAWAGFYRTYMNQKLVILDLEAKTVTDVEGVPLHAKRHTSRLNVFGDKVYVTVPTNEEVATYEVDIATATGTKVAVIDGKTVKGYFNLED